ncbi:hypothetical protein KSS87_006566 [Heliosperma pusillum]|nr:hypothetical protein KSS87_006566 [Heliosperma pusillum]
MKKYSLFTQGFTMQIIGNERDSVNTQGVTMQTMSNERTLIIHTRSYNENNG